MKRVLWVRQSGRCGLRIGDAHTLFGVGIDANIVSASLQAIVSGLERAARLGVLRFAATVPA